MSSLRCVLERRAPGAAPLRVGHRGAGAHCPHNTRLSFETAIEMGVDQMETDVRRCATGELVLSHDDDIQDVEGRRLVVADTPFAELRAADLGKGEMILTLTELLELAQGRSALMLDLKGEGFEAQMVREIRDSGFEPEAIVIPGGSRHSRDLLREIAPEFALSWSLGGYPKERSPEETVESVDTPAVTWYHGMVNRDIVQALHQRGKIIYSWTVDNVETMRRVIEDGVDGVITNRPDLLNSVLGESP